MGIWELVVSLIMGTSVWKMGISNYGNLCGKWVSLIMGTCVENGYL